MILLGGIGYLMFGRSDSASATTTTSTVATGTFQTTVSASGTIDPADEADLDFEVSGRVTSVKVKAGDTVSKGDVLAKLDTVSLDAALASAEAQLEAAQTTAADDGSSSSTQQVSNNAAVASAAADVDTAKDNLAAATLKATISGTVAAVNVAVGDQATGTSSSSSASTGSTGSTGATGGSGGTGGTGTGSTGSSSSSTTSTSTAAVTVVTPKKFVVNVDVAATDIKQVKKGLQVTITPNGATTPIFGTVKDVGLVAETSSTGAATFLVTVSVTGSQSGLYAGTTADVSIVVKQVTNVLSVPTLALTTSGGKTYVQKVTGSGTTKTAVTVGQTYGASTEIKAGLKAGDKVQLTTPTQTGTGTRTGGTGGGGTGFPGGGGFGGVRPGGTGGFGGGGQ
ncbi:MAG: secretion protein HlyD [Aeromicrobium sp.]|nr:secretion protein HlyD [Aeromicrobium sp.]